MGYLTRCHCCVRQGFRQGFRWTCRALFRILENRYESSSEIVPLLHGIHNHSWPWAQGAQGLTQDSVNLLRRMIMDRINDAAGLYAMIGGSLSDAIVYDCNNSRAVYIEELPEDAVHDRYNTFPRLLWSYHWGPHDDNARTCGLRSARTGMASSYIHPVMQYFPPNVSPPKHDPDRQAKSLRNMRYKFDHPSRFSIFFDAFELISR